MNSNIKISGLEDVLITKIDKFEARICYLCGNCRRQV